MSSRTKHLSAGTVQFLIDAAACLLLLAGGVILLGAIAYRVFLQPHLSESEAMALLWPYPLVGVATLIVGWLVDRIEG